jgi:hypothetical protein
MAKFRVGMTGTYSMRSNKHKTTVIEIRRDGDCTLTIFNEYGEKLGRLEVKKGGDIQAYNNKGESVWMEED